MAIGSVTVKVPEPPPLRRRKSASLAGGPSNDVSLEIYSDGCRVWGGTDCAQMYTFRPNERMDAIMGYPKLTAIPHFPAVFKFLSDQYALNRSNPLGAFLENAVEAMETALAEAEGSCVYFAACGSRLKIGWSKKVATRLAQLQTGNAETIRLLGVIPGGRLRERQIHERFAHVRLSGEWFETAPDLMAFIEGAVVA